MKALYSLLRLLSVQDYRSGEDLAAYLNLSRSAIWKRIRRLQQEGIDILSLPNRGYRLQHPISLLDEARLQRALTDQVSRSLQVIDWLISLPSTNTQVLMHKTPIPWPMLGCCIAEHQSGGRGRRGRAWLSPLASNLYLSLVCDMPGQGQWHWLQTLSIQLGIVIAAWLRRQYAIDVRIKWPNDLWVNHAKLGGILIELQGNLHDGFRVVMGLGLNVNMQTATVDQAWTSMAVETGHLLDRTALAAQVINVLVQWLAQPDQGAALLSNWPQYDALFGQAVSVYQGDQVVCGIAQGINAVGELCVQQGECCRYFSAGEVSLRAS